MQIIKEKLFKKLISSFDKNNIDCAILGRTESYPKNINSEIDIVIYKKDFSKYISSFVVKTRYEKEGNPTREIPFLKIFIGHY